jgi:pyridoxal phosphate enzyme (YggS family)
MSLKEKLVKIKEKISSIQEKTGLQNKVEIVAVTKTHPFQIIRNSYEAGFLSIGENRIQEASAKFESFELMPDLKKRFIGHLQSNKIKKCTNLFDTIDTVDNIKLLKKISKVIEKKKRKTSVLLQINTSKDAQKKGFSPIDIENILACFEIEGVIIEGLMTMAPFTNNKKVIRESFKKLRELKEEINAQLKNERISELSMGMSNDYKIAIEEGSTMIRLGTSLFGARGKL